MTFARITSDPNGRKTVILNTTIRKIFTVCQEMLETGDSPTFVPQTSVSIAHLALSYLSEVEDAYTEADVVKNAIRVLFVQLICDGLCWGETKLCWVDGYGILTLGSYRS